MSNMFDIVFTPYIATVLFTASTMRSPDSRRTPLARVQILGASSVRNIVEHGSIHVRDTQVRLSWCCPCSLTVRDIPILRVLSPSLRPYSRPLSHFFRTFPKSALIHGWHRLQTLIMFPTMSPLTSAVVLSFLLLPSSARVIWIPEEFEPHSESSLLTARDVSTCGGLSGLDPCGSALPSNFCCPTSTICLALNTSSSVSAVICCPAGQDCVQINPVSCDESLQNVTTNPKSQLHSDPPQQLDSCGTGCCPMGYACQNSQCMAQVAPSAPSSSATPSSSTSSPTSSATGAAASKPTYGDSSPVKDPGSQSIDSDFNSKSFAAGFVPGIVIGAFIAALLLLLCLRRRRRSSGSCVDEKGRHRDTLTDLGLQQPSRQPTVHGRSISEPCADMSTGHRTEFLRGTPPKAAVPGDPNANGCSVDVRSPASDPITPLPRVRALFSRSPFLTPSTPPSTQPPIPAHLKRGTLSFTISPVRALKKQKSMHSLRRQMTDASRLKESSRSSSRRRMRPDVSRSGSTETIQVLMPSNEPYTPERLAEDAPTLGSATYQPPKSAGTWNTTSSSDDTPDERQQPQPQVPYPSSSRYPSELPYTTPTRPQMAHRTSNRADRFAFLGSPYTPTNHGGSGKGRVGLALPRTPADTRRDTTFSAMMEKAGLRKSDLIMGGGNK